jgi:hypothetical protein
MRIIITPEAASLIEARKCWWRENRPATADLFDAEFLEAVALVAEKPTLFAVFTHIGDRRIRRILMEKTACHLYFEIDDAAAIVKVVSAWGARRSRRPHL